LKLVEARKTAKLTQEEVAGHLGITRQTYAKMESSPDTIEIGEAKKLADLFGVTVDEIFFDSTCN
jgi:putative transcriptional regulator